MKRKNQEIIIGVDEVGRGPLAGPVVACAFVLLNSGSENYFMLDASLRQRGARLIFRDSKRLSEKQREEIFDAIKKCPDFVWAVGEVSEKVIDKINILQATKLAMQKAVKNMLHKCHDRGIKALIWLVNVRYRRSFFCILTKHASIKSLILLS